MTIKYCQIISIYYSTAIHGFSSIDRNRPKAAIHNDLYRLNISSFRYAAEMSRKVSGNEREGCQVSVTLIGQPIDWQRFLPSKIEPRDDDPQIIFMARYGIWREGIEWRRAPDDFERCTVQVDIA